MKKTIIIVILMIIVCVTNSHAKTIWFKDLTDKTFTTWYNMIFDDLKKNKYYKYFKFVNDNKQIKDKPGDLVVEINGMNLMLANGILTGKTYMVIQCQVNNDLTWDYKSSFQGTMNTGFESESAKTVRGKILEFIEKFFGKP
jgi:hypothetical protein